MASNRGRFSSLAAFLGSIRGDLSNITSPPSFLAPESVVEICTCWAERPSLFTAAAREPSAQLRSLLVLKWLLASHRRQFYVGANVVAGLKKPLNAFLGEVFLGKWEDEEATVRTWTEQVSHHPPVTACFMSDTKGEVWGEGYSRVDMTFTTALNVTQTGHSLFHIPRYDEQYLVPFPNFKVKGFFSAHLYPEIVGTYSVVSSSGFVSEITYSGKGILGGAKNQFTAKVFKRDDETRRAIYKVEGCWSGEWTIYDAEGKVMEKWKPEEHPGAALTERPLDAQSPWETRRAWREVISALKAGEFSKAGAEKHKVEEAQRSLRKDADYVKDFQPSFFKANWDARPDFDALASAVPGWELGADKTMGNWRFDKENADTLEKGEGAWHGGLDPATGKRDS